MNIEDFYKYFRADTHKPAELVCNRWEKEKQVDDFLGMEVSSGVIIADLMVGDGTLDQVSPALKEAFEGLMHEKADSYSKIHQILLEKLEMGDKSVWGMVNKVKGQVGENIFRDTCADEGVTATLATSGSQEGWDIAVDKGEGVTQYVQVKMYNNPNEVIKKIIEVDEKVKAGAIFGENGEVVNNIDFAVPEDIASTVEAKLAELNIDIDIIPVNTTANEVAEVVQMGFDNMGAGAMENLFEELLGSTVATAAIHTITNAFLVYKGSKDSEAFILDTIKTSSSSVAGLMTGMSVEMLLNQVAWIGGPPTSALVFATSFSTRAIAKRVLQRGDSTSWVLGINKSLDRLTESIEAA